MIYHCITGFFQNIFQILCMVFERFNLYVGNDIYKILLSLFDIHSSNILNTPKHEIIFHQKIKVGLLTNEIPPIVYGGVATWIVNFIKMFENDPDIEVIPIFLAYNDKLPESCHKKYP